MPDTFEDIVTEAFAPEDAERELYALRALYLNESTGQCRSVVLAVSYDRLHVQRMRKRFGPEILMLAFRKEYKNACPLHWSPIGIRTVRLAEIPF